MAVEKKWKLSINFPLFDEWVLTASENRVSSIEPNWVALRNFFIDNVYLTSKLNEGQ